MPEDVRDRLWLAVTGGLQGLAIWVLAEAWPDEHAARAGAAALLSFLAVSSLVFHFVWSGASRGRLVALAVGTGLVYAATAGWVGWVVPVEFEIHRQDQQRVATWVIAALVTLYVLGPFLQIFQRTGRLHFPYEDLFLHGWNNFFVALVGALFVAALWTVLFLWAALFELVGIDFFGDLFGKACFISVVTGAAAGFGVALGRESERVVSTLRGITLAVFRGLLPLVAFVALIFLAVLPFTGLDVLWDTNHASQLLLTWVALTVLFLNAVYQDGSEREGGLPGPMRWLVEAALLAMAVFAAIAAYGISARIGQYGLTPQRVWMALATIVLGAYAFGYAGAVLRRGTPWLRAIRAVNLFVALLAVALGLLTHTPWLDPLGLSARSQFARLAEGRASAAEFDYGTLYFQLGQVGAERFEALAGLTGHPEHAEILAQMERTRLHTNYWEWNQERPGSEGLEFLTEKALPEGLHAAIRNMAQASHGHGCGGDNFCKAAPFDYDGEPPLEWLVAIGTEHWAQLHLLAETNEGFERIGESLNAPRAPRVLELFDAMREGRIEAVEPAHRDILIDGERYRVLDRAR